MITVKPSQTADTRTCDFANTSKATLLASSAQHIGDVGQALAFFGALITAAAVRHDTDKLADIDGFHADFVTGFVQTGWWDRHRALNRHHLQQPDGIPADVNLIDVLDFIADCVMAGMARSGSVYPIALPPELLERAFQNTVALLTAQVTVAPIHQEGEDDELDAAPVGEPAAMPTEMPEVRPGDWVRLSGFGWTPVSKQREAELLTGNDGVEEIKRPTVIWRRTDRKEQTK